MAATKRTRTPRRPFKVANFGSVSSGTMQPRDLVPEFYYTLRKLGGKVGDLKYHKLNNIDRLTDRYWDSDDCNWDLDTLFERLEQHAPPFGYFGASEGDGSDYGFWFSSDSFEDSARDREVCKVPAGDPWPDPLPDGTQYVAEISNHGNVSLYIPGPDGTETGCQVVWELV